MKKNTEFNMFSMPENEGSFEDISSSSSSENTVDLYSFSNKKNTLKRTHVKQSKFSDWWKKRKVWQKSAIISAASFILIFALLIGILAIVFDYNYNSITKDPNELGFENVLSEDVVNVALFGLDTRNVNSFKGNADSIMILSLNTKTKKVKIISVMRDTFTHMTYNGKKSYGKINSAYSKGGPELAIKTLNTIFGLDISEYATVNFYGMVDIIDAVGGIEVELTSQEVTRNANKKAINFCVQEICTNLKLNPKDYYVYKSGVQKLNGVQAVAYSRIRYVPNIWGTNNDYGRTDRQRFVMEQLFNKAITLDKTQYVKLAKSLIPCSETSLSYSEIMSLAFGILLHSPSFEQTRMPQPEFLMSSPSGYGSVVYYDFDYAKDLIHAFIYDDISPEDYIAANEIQKNDWYSEMRGISSNKKPSSITSSVTSSNTDSSVSDKPSLNSSGQENTESEDTQSNSSDMNNSSNSSQLITSDNESTGSDVGNESINSSKNESMNESDDESKPNTNESVESEQKPENTTSSEIQQPY